MRRRLLLRDHVRGAVRPVSMLITAAVRADSRGATLTLILDVARGLTAPLYGLWLKFLVDAAIRHDGRLALLGAVGMAASSGIPWLAGGTGSRLRLALEERVGFFLERRLAELAGGRRDLAHYENPEYLDRLHLVREARGTLGNAVGALVIIAGMIAQATTVFVLLATVHPLLLFLPALGIPIFVAEGAWQRRVGDAEEATAEAERMASHLEDLAMSAASAKELRILGLEWEILRRHRDALLLAHAGQSAAQWKGAIAATAAWLLFALGFASSIAFVAWQATRGQASAGDIVLVISLTGSARISLAGLIRAASRALRLLKSANRLLWLEDYARDQQLGHGQAGVPVRLHDGISLHNVGFRYPNSQRWALHDVSLSLSAGSVVALVGENGAGKTSLVKLLCSFYQPTYGRIDIDGTDLGTVESREWRKHVSASFQDFARFQLLLRETVGVGDLPRLEDSGAVAHALDAAGATAVPARFSAGLETQLGRDWDGGVDLSGGQWQKLALARGMMRQTPLLLVLDEPTAALDAPTEHRLFERMTSAARQGRAQGGITLLVSHRFSTVRMADHIIVLAAGRVVEVGTHDELLAKQGLYAELYNLQAKSYE